MKLFHLILCCVAMYMLGMSVANGNHIGSILCVGLFIFHTRGFIKDGPTGEPSPKKR